MSSQLDLIALNAILGIIGMLFVPRRERYFLNPVNTFWLTFLYFASFQPASNLEAYNAKFGAENVSSTLFAFSVCAVCLYIGNRVGLGVFVARLLPAITDASRRRLNRVALILLLFGIAMTFMLLAAYGGWMAYFQRTNLRLLEVDVSDYLTLGPQIATFAVLVGLVTNTYYRRGAATFAYGVVAIFLLAWFIYHGSRSSALLLGVILVGSFYAPTMRRPNFIVLLTATAAMAVTIGFIGAYRAIFTDFGSYAESLSISEVVANSFGFISRSEESGFSSVSINEDFGMAAAVVANVPGTIDYDYGYMFLQTFTQWIPKSIWADKIYPDGQAWDLLHRVAETSQYTNAAGYLAGPAPTIVGKYYYVWGLPGVVYGSLISGVMLKSVWSYTLRLPANIRAIFMIACAPIGFMEANNPNLWLTFWLPTAGVTLALVLVLARIRRSRRVIAR